MTDLIIKYNKQLEETICALVKHGWENSSHGWAYRSEIKLIHQILHDLENQVCAHSQLKNKYE